MSIYLGTTPIADGASTALLSEKANVSLNNLSSGLSNTICTTKATTTSSASSSKPAVIKQNYVNGKSWYRVWSDGWIEQGGWFNSSNAITFLKAFSNNNYNLQISSGYDHAEGSSVSYSAYAMQYNYKSATGFTPKNYQGVYQNGAYWYSCGY